MCMAAFLRGSVHTGRQITNTATPTPRHPPTPPPPQPSAPRSGSSLPQLWSHSSHRGGGNMSASRDRSATLQRQVDAMLASLDDALEGGYAAPKRTTRNPTFPRPAAPDPLNAGAAHARLCVCLLSGCHVVPAGAQTVHRSHRRLRQRRRPPLLRRFHSPPSLPPPPPPPRHFPCHLAASLDSARSSRARRLRTALRTRKPAGR
jgi:hypothetical protein